MIVRRRHVVQWVQFRQFPGITRLGEKFEHMMRKHSAISTLYAILPPRSADETIRFVWYLDNRLGNTVVLTDTTGYLT